MDAPQPPTWRAKCRRVTPTERGWSDYRREFERGLNTEVTRSLTNTATVLVELVEDQHGRDEHAVVYPGSRPSRGGKAATSCLSVLICLWRLQLSYKERRKGGVFVFLARMLVQKLCRRSFATVVVTLLL